MMASINPLGERARGNRFWHTATAFMAGCLAGGLALGAAAGAAGALAAALTGGSAGAALVAAAVTLAAGCIELAGWPVPTIRRQVDEAWLGRYRGWVYGTGFGAQLGAGLATTVTTATVYAMVGLAVLLGLAGRPGWAVAAGATFGLARALPVLAGATGDPDRLRRRASQVAAAATASRLAAGASLCALGVWAVVA